MSQEARALHRAGLAVVVSACTAALTSAASAAEPPRYVVENGVAQFPNVRVINAPIAATSASGSPGAGGLRAYVDADTGELRQPNPEELQAAAAETQAATTLQARTAGPQMTATPSGGIRVMLDESQMQYSVITRHADGTTSEACVTGEQEATRLTTVGIEKPVAREGETR